MVNFEEPMNREENFSSQIFTVEETQTARAVGSGELEVLATPALAAMIENTCMNYLKGKGYVLSGETTVGTNLQLSHRRPSKVGQEIRVEVKLIEKANQLRSFDFSFHVFMEETLISEGTHQRVKVQIEQFLKKN
ncbi:hypothetical protein IGI37_001865 [Enterococcus sp. AZ194]|uniref:thioesterase family protein n=1 Tax=Enterococcus sp. AZ194 TaxID=2774629 RepID=UPI003F22958D